MILAIDVGATFTDFVLLNDQEFRSHKIFSTVHAPENAMLKGIHDLELTEAFEHGQLLIIHNSNEATNTLLKKYGANTIFINDHKILLPHFLTAFLKTPALLFFNMGSTSSSVSLIQNNILIAEESINIGSESIAFLDGSQLLQIKSPPSGTHANSACYGLGEDQPTITDANLILGRIRPDIMLGNAIRPDINSARMALANLAGIVNTRVENVALTIINTVNQKIIATLQSILNAHYHNAAPITLCATGSGGLHICAAADALNIKNVVVPLFSGVFSAFDMLITAEPTARLPCLNYKKLRASHEHIKLQGITLPVSVWQRNELSPEEMMMGPAIIIEDTSTTFLQNGWLAYVDSIGHLLLRRMAIDIY